MQRFLLTFGAPTLLLAALLLQPFYNAVFMFPDPIIAAQISYARNSGCCGVYFGFISNLGAVLWGVAATVCGCAVLVLRAARAPARYVAMMTAAAMLTSVLYLDDLLLMHESILPELGVPQTPVLAIYALAGLAYTLAFRKEISQGDMAIFLCGLACLVTSLGVDLIVERQSDSTRIVEDSAKFLGIAGWASFHVFRAADLMRLTVANLRS